MLTHRRHSKTLASFVMLFAEAKNEQYGNHVWTLETELPAACECEELIAFAMEYLGCDRDEAIAMIDPQNIVDSACLWDDAQFVSDLWQAMEPVGYRTADGAVVLDRESVLLSYSVDCGCEV